MMGAQTLENYTKTPISFIVPFAFPSPVPPFTRSLSPQCQNARSFGSVLLVTSSALRCLRVLHRSSFIYAAQKFEVSEEPGDGTACASHLRLWCLMANLGVSTVCLLSFPSWANAADENPNCDSYPLAASLGVEWSDPNYEHSRGTGCSGKGKFYAEIYQMTSIVICVAAACRRCYREGVVKLALSDLERVFITNLQQQCGLHVQVTVHPRQIPLL